MFNALIKVFFYIEHMSAILRLCKFFRKGANIIFKNAEGLQGQNPICVESLPIYIIAYVRKEKSVCYS